MNAEAAGAVWSIQTDTYDIYRAVKFIATYAGEEPQIFERYYVLLTMADDDTAPPRYFIDSPGFQGSGTLQIGDPVFPPLYLLATWDAVMGALIVDILEDWSNGVAMVDEVNEETTMLSGVYHAWTKRQTYDLLSEQVTIVQQFAILHTPAAPPPAPQISYFNNPRITPASVAVPSGLPNTALNAIAEALTNLSTQDLDITFNNGRSIFSIRSNVLTGQ